MSVKVQLRPSGKEFRVEHGETVLEAALRSGLALDHGCNNGSCGDCRARLVSGELSEVLPHDYVLKDSDRAINTVLLCCSRPATDLVIEASEAGRPEDLPVERIEATVYKLHQPSKDIMVLELRTPRSQTLRFLAGQHATLHFDGIAPRNKSIASCPCNGMFLQFHIRRVPDDDFAEYAFEQLKPRDKVVVEGPHGSFHLDEDSRRPMLLIAYETGFAPIKSLIEHAISLELTQPLRLYWVAPQLQDHYMVNYCRAWGDALADFRFQLINSDGAGVEGQLPWRELGLNPETLTRPQRDMACAAQRVVQDYPDLSGHDLYCCGPESLMPVMRALLTRHGLPPERLFVDHIERF